MVREIDLEEIPAIYNIDDIEKHHRDNGSTQQYFRGMDTMVGFTKATAEVDETGQHSHPWEQINFVVEGSCTFQVGEKRIEIQEGDIFVIPPDTPHTSEPPDDSCTICFISPLREDYLERTDYQREFSDN